MVILTGIKPTGLPHLGNYVGAIKPALSMLHEHQGRAQGLYFIADYHALIDRPTAKDFRQSVYEVAASWLACGLYESLQKEHAVLYLQSHIPEIMELQWILQCFTSKGTMNRSHAYKAQVQRNQHEERTADEGVSMGLYSYPVLMAADILLPGADVVPVGADQKQHVEVARDLAEKIHHIYEQDHLFVLPEARICAESVLMGVDGQKMSKTYHNTIPLFLSFQALRKTVMRIPTDSSAPTEPKPFQGVIAQIYQSFATAEQTAELKTLYAQGVGWGQVKEKLCEVLEDRLRQPRDLYQRLMQDPRQMDEILQQGAQVVRAVAQKRLQTIKDILGCV